MVNKQTITINGREYDPQTGLPVETSQEKVTPQPQPQPRHHHTPSSHIHSTLQKSKTLNRRAVQRPAKPQTQAAQVASPRKHMDIARSSSISRFAPKPVVTPAAPAKADIGPIAHPLQHKANHAINTKKQTVAPVVHKPSQVIKNEAIQTALQTPAKQKQKTSLKKRFPRVFSVSSVGLAVFLLAGYLSYLNMPTLSIRVAAVQSGINATYPDYRPSGYRLDGPIAYDDGQVSMKFAANAGPQNFTITEQQSNWNSSAVLEKYVQPKVDTDSDYTAHTQSGLTIYTYDNNAAWVNGGILYTIEGNAPLSKDQVLRIATSL
jgi:hypothetical protein